MSLGTEDGLDWFKTAGIKLTPKQEAQAWRVGSKCSVRAWLNGIS